MTKRILIIILIFPLLINCEKEKIVEVIKEKEYNWKLHNGFKHNNVVQMNSYVTDDRLFFYGHSSFTAVIADSSEHLKTLLGGEVIHYGVKSEHFANKKLPICSDYSIKHNSNLGSLCLFPVNNPVLSGASAVVDLKQIDNTFAYFDFIHFSKGECIAINDQKQSLVPYKSLMDNGIALRLALLDVRLTEKMTSSFYIDNIDVKLLSIEDINQYGVIALETIGDYFYLTTNSKVYRIDPVGNVESVLSTRLNNIIEFSGKLYGFGINSIYVSSNNGLSWDKAYSISRDYALLDVTKIDNKIIGYKYGQLWELLISETELKAVELDNNGLEGVSITSVSKFDEKIYLSTLSGVYYKGLDEFYDSKIESE